MTIYTAIFGNYDELKTPIVRTEGWNYVCFTDQDLKSDIWEIRKVSLLECGPIKTARFYKIMGFILLNDTFSIWVDGTFFINVDLNEWMKQAKHNFTTIRHPFDRCLYVDVSSCLGLGKGNSEELVKQVKYYRQLGIPENNGLISSGIMMRKHTPEVIEVCEAWWAQVKQFSSRDQVAFGYVNWKFPECHQSFDWDYTYMDEFIHIPHLTKKWREGKLNRIKELYGIDTK